MTTRPVLVMVVTCVLMPAVDALAQPAEPIGPFAADVRVVFPRFKEDTTVAAQLGVASADLPSLGLGLAGGLHWYPGRLGKMTIGLGGEILFSGASKSPSSDNSADIEGASVNTRFSALSPQLSLNFGKRQGWSYLTGGIGLAGFYTELSDAPVSSGGSRPRQFNYGGGARWFAKEHLAFSLDLRFYAVSAQDAAPGRPAYPSMTLMVFSGGVSFK